MSVHPLFATDPGSPSRLVRHPMLGARQGIPHAFSDSLPNDPATEAGLHPRTQE